LGRKPRPDPLEQGDLRRIFDLFFAPTFLMKPADVSAADWMNELFSLRDVDIIRYVAKKRFRMPGLYVAAPYHLQQGVGYRLVRPGDDFQVRIDTRTPDIIQVDWFSGRGKKEHVYQLNGLEWTRIQPFIEEAERKKKEKR